MAGLLELTSLLAEFLLPFSLLESQIDFPSYSFVSGSLLVL